MKGTAIKFARNSCKRVGVLQVVTRRHCLLFCATAMLFHVWAEARQLVGNRERHNTPSERVGARMLSLRMCAKRCSIAADTETEYSHCARAAVTAA